MGKHHAVNCYQNNMQKPWPTQPAVNNAKNMQQNNFEYNILADQDIQLERRIKKACYPQQSRRGDLNLSKDLP